MSFLSNIFGNSDTVKKATEGVYHGVDKAFFTDEEKADFRLKWGDWILEYMRSTQPQNVARRLIAFIVVGVWAFLILLIAGSILLGSAVSEPLFKLLKEVVLQPFNIVLGFYFLTHAIKGIRKP
ncbi:hypothetical protein [Endozoicomonas sp. ALC066]|uniref:hypothetical protein n=1 Tax=Endozoicomonas sp. ALC066 TaxID=3403078 RepID=UPI003BB4E061